MGVESSSSRTANPEEVSAYSLWSCASCCENIRNPEERDRRRQYGKAYTPSAFLDEVRQEPSERRGLSKAITQVGVVRQVDSKLQQGLLAPPVKIAVRPGRSTSPSPASSSRSRPTQASKTSVTPRGDRQHRG